VRREVLEEASPIRGRATRTRRMLEIAESVSERRQAGHAHVGAQRLGVIATEKPRRGRVHVAAVRRVGEYAVCGEKAQHSIEGARV